MRVSLASVLPDGTQTRELQHLCPECDVCAFELHFCSLSVPRAPAGRATPQSTVAAAAVLHAAP
jgi:hypothetical protein